MENSPVFKEIKEDLELFDNWEDRYAYIIDLGKNCIFRMWVMGRRTGAVVIRKR